MKHLIIWGLLATITFYVSGQKKADTLYLNDGRTFAITSYELQEDSIFVVQITTPNKTKTQQFDYDEVFAIKKGNGKEIVFYKKITNEDLSEQEMKTFIAGERSALSGYRPRLTTIVNYFLSSGITFFAGTHGVLFYAPLVVMIPMVIMAYINPPQPSYGNDIYKAGYVISAKHKKIKCLIKSSLAGIVTGGAASFLWFKL